MYGLSVISVQINRKKGNLYLPETELLVAPPQSQQPVANNISVFVFTLYRDLILFKYENKQIIQYEIMTLVKLWSLFSIFQKLTCTFSVFFSMYDDAGQVQGWH